MATFTATSTDVCRPHRGPVRLRTFPEGPGQAFKRGYPARRSGTSTNENQIVVAASAASTGLVGFFAEAASGTTNNPISVYLAEPGVEFRARIKSGQTILNAIQGVTYAGVIDTSANIYRVDTSDTTNLAVDVISLIDAHGDVNGYVSFEVTRTARDLFKG